MVENDFLNIIWTGFIVKFLTYVFSIEHVFRLVLLKTKEGYVFWFRKNNPVVSF